MIEIIDTERAFELRQAIVHLLKAVLPEKLMLLLFEIFGYRVIFVGGHKFAELRKKISILARRVRPIHGDEGMHRRHELPPAVADCGLDGCGGDPLCD